jgi:DNA-binding MarR family transcriptional regulator
MVLTYHRMAEEPLYASTGFLLAIVGADSRRRFAQMLSAWDLSPGHFGALMSVAEFGSPSQQELGRATGIDPRNLVPLLDVLGERGLLERQPHPRDRRRHVVRLTSAGRSLLKQMQKRGAEVEEEMLGELSAGERKALHQMLLKLAPRPERV